MVRLDFYFPAAAKAGLQSTFEEVEKATGWKVVINERPHQGMAGRLVRDLLPEGWELSGEPSLLHEKGAIRITVHGRRGSMKKVEERRMEEEAEENRTVETEMKEKEEKIKEVKEKTEEEDEIAKRLKAEFREQTLLDLIIDNAKPEPPVSSDMRDDHGRMEINAAYREVDDAFADCPHRPYRKSLKGDTIVLRFISPSIGKRYGDVIKGLSWRTGWNIHVHPAADQNRILTLIQMTIPRSWGLVKTPSFHGAGTEDPFVKVKLSSTPSDEEWNEVAAKIREATGIRMELC
jgi:hypothetical protein